MSYYNEMSPLAHKQFYEQQKRYRSTMKNTCLVFPKWCHVLIKEAADKIGMSVTRFMVYSSLRMAGEIRRHGAENFNFLTIDPLPPLTAYKPEGFEYVHDQD